MPFTDNSNQGSSSPLTSLGRSIWSIRRESDHSLSTNREPSSQDLKLESFQKQVADRFHDLLAADSDELLSIVWIHKLLDAFMSVLEEFRVILLNNKTLVSKPPLDRLIAEFFERSVKALDICNATRDGIEKIRTWKKHLDIVLIALESRQRPLSEGQFRRARKTLMDLALAMLDEKDSGSYGSIFSNRNRSFGRHNTTSKDHHHQRHHSSGHSRSHSWGVSRTWSAAKQLQSIANNLIPPRSNEIVATNGLVIPIFTMNSVLIFVLWALVATIPCQDRALNIHLSVPRQFSWGAPFLSLYERIIEESKKRERRNSSGLLREIYQVERSSRYMTDLIDSVQFPLTEDQKTEVQRAVLELNQVCEALKTGLNPLECLVREVFRKIMNIRIEGLDFLGIAGDVES